MGVGFGGEIAWDIIWKKSMYKEERGNKRKKGGLRPPFPPEDECGGERGY